MNKIMKNIQDMCRYAPQIRCFISGYNLAFKCYSMNSKFESYFLFKKWNSRRAREFLIKIFDFHRIFIRFSIYKRFFNERAGCVHEHPGRVQGASRARPGRVQGASMSAQDPSMGAQGAPRARPWVQRIVKNHRGCSSKSLKCVKVKFWSGASK